MPKSCCTYVIPLQKFSWTFVFSWDSHEKTTFSWELSKFHENFSWLICLVRILFFSWELLKPHENFHELFDTWEFHFSHHNWECSRDSFDISWENISGSQGLLVIVLLSLYDHWEKLTSSSRTRAFFSRPYLIERGKFKARAELINQLQLLKSSLNCWQMEQLSDTWSVIPLFGCMTMPPPSWLAGLWRIDAASPLHSVIRMMPQLQELKRFGNGLWCLLQILYGEWHSLQHLFNLPLQAIHKVFQMVNLVF